LARYSSRSLNIQLDPPANGLYPARKLVVHQPSFHDHLLFLGRFLDSTVVAQELLERVAEQDSHSHDSETNSRSLITRDTSAKRMEDMPNTAHAPRRGDVWTSGIVSF
jgi:hypothetical protein